MQPTQEPPPADRGGFPRPGDAHLPAPHAFQQAAPPYGGFGGPSGAPVGAPVGPGLSQGPVPAGLVPLPVGSPGFPGAPPYRPQLARTIVNVGAPTGGLIVAGVATALALGYDFFQNPALAVLGGVLAGGVSVLVVLAYLWLDRWEPEPPRLLLFAWLWGGIAVVFSLITSLFDTDVFVSTVIRAPIVEELAKGAFLVLMLTGVRRREVNTLTDCIVYAGMVGAAFGFIENVLYIARGESIAGSLGLALVRLPTPFLHPFFTTVTAIGLYVGLSKTTRGARWGFLGLGYAGAVILHMIWNATGLAAHALLFLPLFGGAVALAIVTRNREHRVLLAQLPGIVSSGLIRPHEAAWLATLQGRKIWRTHAGEFNGPQARKAVDHVAGAVTEIAFVRERIDRGMSDRETYGRLEELTATILGQPHPPVPPGPAPLPPTVAPTAQPAPPSGWSPIPGPPYGMQPAPQHHLPAPGGHPSQGSGQQGPGPQGPGQQTYPGRPGYPAQVYPPQNVGPNPDGVHQLGPDPRSVPGGWPGPSASAASATEPTIAVAFRRPAQPPPDQRLDAGRPAGPDAAPVFDGGTSGERTARPGDGGTEPNGPARHW